MKQNRVLKLLTMILPIIIVIGMAIIFIQNYLYNTRLRTCNLADGELVNGVYEFDEASVEIAVRSGDSGAWMKGALLDLDGTELMPKYVGAIYEVSVTNKSPNVMSDWELTLYIPEDMLLNNSWNGELELHQNVKGDEKVQYIDLANFSRYDITLDYFIDPSGVMVKMYEGDYFIYHPDADVMEMPIPAAKANSEKPSFVKIGFIPYIANQPITYVADFSRGELRYHLRASVLRDPMFWVFAVLTIVWIICFVSLIIVKINIRRLVEQKKRDEQIIEQTMRTFVNFIEAKDPSTMGHSLRVAKYSTLLAERIGYDDDECKNIYYIALMHDCGKLYIPDEILSKPAKLTDEEYEIMKKHTIYGNDILRDFTSIDNIQLGAMYHHERYDGKGYPKGIAGENIPLVARIICVSDAFDAMNSQRCYRKNLTPEVILNELKTNRGTQFDPMVIDHLLKLIDEGKVKFT